MSQIIKITINEVEYLTHQLAKELYKWDKPIPDFGSRFPGKLEGCLIAPFQTFSRRNLYKGLVEKAAILFYLMIKNHPFQNGNKRIAMTTMLIFLNNNNKWLRVDNQKLYNHAKWVAESDPDVKDATIKGINDFVTKHLINTSNLPIPLDK